MSAACCKKSVVGNLVASTHELSPLFNLAHLNRGFDHIIIKLRAHQPWIRSYRGGRGSRSEGPSEAAKLGSRVHRGISSRPSRTARASLAVCLPPLWTTFQCKSRAFGSTYRARDVGCVHKTVPIPPSQPPRLEASYTSMKSSGPSRAAQERWPTL